MGTLSNLEYILIKAQYIDGADEAGSVTSTVVVSQFFFKSKCKSSKCSEHLTEAVSSRPASLWVLY